MYAENDNLRIKISETGARVSELQFKGEDFFYPQQFIKKNGKDVERGGMHICSPIFGTSEGKGKFSQAPQHGELRNLSWNNTLLSKGDFFGVCSSKSYTEWGENLFYLVQYILNENILITYTDIHNQGSSLSNVELGWHPYFNAKNGGKIIFHGIDIQSIDINGSYGPKIFPSCTAIEIILYDIGKVTMFLKDDFENSFICVWTDWEGKYFCVEPLISYEKYTKGIKINPGKNFFARFVMIFDHI